MRTENARAYSNADELLRALGAESRETGAAVVAAVVARAEADSLTARLSEAGAELAQTIDTLTAAKEEAAAEAATAAKASREAAGALVTLEPEIEALERGQSEENRRERGVLNEVRRDAERAHIEADAALNRARHSLAAAQREAASLRDKLAALATVPQADDAALAPLAAALWPVAQR
jgi:chromosome segregation ATPase